MKLVIDTNVLLSAAFFPGVCEALLTRCFVTPEVEIILSEHIIEEFIRHGTGKMGGARSDIERSVAELRIQARIVEPAGVEAGLIEDVDDLPVLGTAVAGSADYLATGDRELLTLGRIASTTILAPRDLLKTLQTAP